MKKLAILVPLVLFLAQPVFALDPNDVVTVQILASDGDYHSAHVTLRDGTVISISGRKADIFDPELGRKTIPPSETGSGGDHDDK